MKYVVISRLAPGVENYRKSLEVFMKAGAPPGTQTLYAAADGKTFISIIESDDENDMRAVVSSLTYAPFWEETTIHTVRDVDEAWLQAIQEAQANWA
jgi:hypothetical protein